VPDKENTKYFTGKKKCGGEKIAQRAKPDCNFSEPKMPGQGILQLPFVMCRALALLIHIQIRKYQLLNIFDKYNFSKLY
jgi:hypothetical protein